MNKSKRGYVYLLCDQEHDYVFKIGVTKGSLENRIKKLQTGNSGEITIRTYFETDYPFFIEKWLHLKFMTKKISGEWYELTDEDLEGFHDLCKSYENIVHEMKDNPFFPKNVK